ANEGYIGEYLWHSGLSGADYAIGAETRRIFTRRSRSDAPGNGEEEEGRDGAPRREVHPGSGRSRHRGRESPSNLHLDGSVCRLWIQPLSLICLRLSGLSDRIFESSPPGPFFRRGSVE